MQLEAGVAHFLWTGVSFLGLVFWEASLRASGAHSACHQGIRVTDSWS